MTTSKNGSLSNGVFNRHLKNLDNDVLYHFGMSRKTHDFHHLFGDVKFVCCGGSVSRMKKCALILTENLPPSVINRDLIEEPENLCQSDRYVIYKVGPVLCVSHGIGIPSMSVMLHEMFKLIHYAGRHPDDVTFIRMGTSGGLGVEPGTVVVSDGAVNGLLEKFHEAFVVGKRINHPLKFDTTVVNDMIKAAKHLDQFEVIRGMTMSCDDFYEAQGRLDGAFCAFDETEKMTFLEKAHCVGVRNIEMEATAFSAMCLRAGFKCGVVCVTLVNRLLTDQVTSSPAMLKSWEERPCKVLVRFVTESLMASETTKNGYRFQHVDNCTLEA